MKELDRLPIWVLLAFAVLRRNLLRRQAAAGKAVNVDLVAYRTFLDQFFGALPLPTNALETWLVKQLESWLDNEIETVTTLARIRLALIGTVPVVDAADAYILNNWGEMK